MRHLRAIAVPVAAWAAGCGLSLAQPLPATAPPQALGFAHFYKCPFDGDVDHLGDTITPQACAAACEAHGGVAGCWWLDGTGGFARECRACRTLSPVRGEWPNDWSLKITTPTS